MGCLRLHVGLRGDVGQSSPRHAPQLVGVAADSVERCASSGTLTHQMRGGRLWLSLPQLVFMPAAPVQPSSGDTLLLVGTMKGAFIYRSNRDRSNWEMSGPHFPGEAVYALTYDHRGGRNRLLAATRSFHWGANIR